MNLSAMNLGEIFVTYEFIANENIRFYLETNIENVQYFLLMSNPLMVDIQQLFLCSPKFGIVSYLFLWGSNASGAYLLNICLEQTCKYCQRDCVVSCNTILLRYSSSFRNSFIVSTPGGVRGAKVSEPPSSLEILSVACYATVFVQFIQIEQNCTIFFFIVGVGVGFGVGPPVKRGSWVENIFCLFKRFVDFRETWLIERIEKKFGSPKLWLK